VEAVRTGPAEAGVEGTAPHRAGRAGGRLPGFLSIAAIVSRSGGVGVGRTMLARPCAGRAGSVSGEACRRSCRSAVGGR